MKGQGFDCVAFDDAYAVDVAFFLSALQVIDLFVIEDIPERTGLGLAEMRERMIIDPFFSSPLRHLERHAGYLLEQLTRLELFDKRVVSQQLGKGLLDEEVPAVESGVVPEVRGGNLVINYYFLSVAVDVEGADGQAHLLYIDGLDLLKTVREVRLHNFQYLDHASLACAADSAINTRHLLVHV